MQPERAVGASPTETPPGRFSVRPPVRVVLVGHTAELGGAELSMERLLLALPTGRVDPHVILFSEGPLVARLKERGVSVEVLPLAPRLLHLTRHEVTAGSSATLRSVLGYGPFALRLAARLRALRPDVVHSNSLKAHLVAVPASRLAGVPLVWHMHDRVDEAYLPRALVRLVRALARTAPARVVVNSRATGATLPGVASVVAYPGLTPDQIRSDGPDHVPPPTPVVGLVGRISPTKGQLEFVTAASIVLQSHPDARFRIVGAPAFGAEEHEQRVRALAERLGITDRVTFTGFVDPTAEEVDGMTVCVHASGTPEPFGAVIAEAMARGVPVVATRAGGVPEIVEPHGPDDPLGLLVPPHDPAALAAAVVAVLDDPTSAHDRAVKAWSYASTSFRIETMAATLAQVWDGVADLPGPRHSVVVVARGRPRVAIVHDYLTQRGGAERVVLAIAAAFPDAAIHTSVYEPDETFPEFAGLDVRVGPLNKVGPVRRNHRIGLPLYAPAFSTMTVDADVVVVSSSGWAHGVRATGRTLVYCHNPARWLYQTEEYLGTPATRSPMGLALLPLRPLLRRWDQRAAPRANAYLANSSVVAERIRSVYGIDAPVLFPPCGVDRHGAQDPVPEVADWAEAGFHLVVSRLMPYKNVEAVLEAFRDQDRRLLVVGRGPLAERIAAIAPPNVRLAAGLSDAQLRWAYARATAVVAPSYEDFGLTPLEGMTFGKPTIALRAGGYLDTVVEGRTGLFFDSAEPRAIRCAVEHAEAVPWSAEEIRRHADGFSRDRFVRELRRRVHELA